MYLLHFILSQMCIFIVFKDTSLDLFQTLGHGWFKRKYIDRYGGFNSTYLGNILNMWHLFENIETFVNELSPILEALSN